MMGGPPPPPLAPVPDKLPFGMKEKPKYKLEQPMKRLNWTKVQPKQLKENSLWVKANEDRFASDDVFQMLMENFSTKTVKTSKLADRPTDCLAPIDLDLVLTLTCWARF